MKRERVSRQRMAGGVSTDFANVGPAIAPGRDNRNSGNWAVEFARLSVHFASSTGSALGLIRNPHT